MAYIYKSPYEQSWVAANEELGLLEQEKQQILQRLQWIDVRAKQLEAYLEATSHLVEQGSVVTALGVGLTQICREFLDRSGQWMTAPEIRAALAVHGIDLSPYSNPMAVLHSVLKRVAQTQRVGGTLYYGSANIPGMLTSPEAQ